MNKFEEENYLNNLIEETEKSRTELIDKYKHDKDGTDERKITQKLLIVENISKQLMKYKSIKIKEKQKANI